MVGRKGTGKKKFPICALLAVLCIAALSGWIWFTWEKIPASIRIKAGVSQELSFNVPVSGEVYLSLDEQKEAVPAAGMQMETVGKEQSLHVDLSRPVTMMASRTQSYKMDVRLFGVIPFKTVDVQVIPDKMLIPAGIPIGIYVKTDGVMVIAQGEFEGIDHSVKEPARHLLMAGDYILKADGQELTSKQELTEKIASGGGEEMVLTIRRDGEVFDIRVKPQQDAAGEYKLGIWIRDNAQGVGTMTYLEEDASFGALGHGINDTDTALLMDVGQGSLYRTKIVDVKKGQDGVPGELTGVIDYNKKNRIGTIDQNCVEGIFGTMEGDISQQLQKEAVPIGLKQDVRTGEATIRCCVDENSVPTEYTVEITAVHPDHDNVNQGLEIRVTDPKLLAQTGGIVQGMSGSPILQDGKIIGAVTHVLVQDPTRGYGIFIENMLGQE